MDKSIADHLAPGFSPQMAAYFAAGRRHITAVQPNDDFTLTLVFDNGETRLYNAAPLLEPHTVFAPLRDPAVFRRVYLDEAHAVAWDIDPTLDSSKHWNNKIDLCPDTCYVESVPIADAPGIPH